MSASKKQIKSNRENTHLEDRLIDNIKMPIVDLKQKIYQRGKE